MRESAWLAGGGNPNHDERGRFAPGPGGGSAKADLKREMEIDRHQREARDYADELQGRTPSAKETGKAISNIGKGLERMEGTEQRIKGLQNASDELERSRDRKTELWNRQTSQAQVAARRAEVAEGIKQLEGRQAHKERRASEGKAPVDWAKAEAAGKKHVEEQAAKGKAKIAATRRTEDRKLKAEAKWLRGQGQKDKADEIAKLGCGAKKRWTE